MHLTKGKLFLIGVVVMAAGAAIMFGALQFIPRLQIEKDQLHAASNELTGREIATVKKSLGKNPDANAIRNAAAQTHAIETEQKQTDHQIDTQIVGCPGDQPLVPGKVLGYETVGCEHNIQGKDDQFIWPALFDPLTREHYGVRYYAYSSDGSKTRQPLVAIPDIQKNGDGKHDVVAQDPGSPHVVMENGKIVAYETDFTLAGRLKIYPHGAAYVELVRK